MAEPPSARAADEVEDKQRLFREQYEQAESAYNAKNYSLAVERLQATYAIEPVPQILFNIAQAYRKLYLYTDARVYYELYRTTAKNLVPDEVAVVERHIQEMRAAERASSSPRVVEKTKLLFMQSEKPPPRWMLPVGITAAVLGVGGLAGGIAVLALDGQCTGPPVGQALQCDQVYSTRLPGSLIAVAGGSVTVLGAVLIALSARKPMKPVLTETRLLPSDDELLPLLSGEHGGSGAPRRGSPDGKSDNK